MPIQNSKPNHVSTSDSEPLTQDASETSLFLRYPYTLTPNSRSHTYHLRQAHFIQYSYFKCSFLFVISYYIQLRLRLNAPFAWNQFVILARFSLHRWIASRPNRLGSTVRHRGAVGSASVIKSAGKPNAYGDRYGMGTSDPSSWEDTNKLYSIRPVCVCVCRPNSAHILTANLLRAIADDHMNEMTTFGCMF